MDRRGGGVSGKSVGGGVEFRLPGNLGVCLKIRKNVFFQSRFVKGEGRFEGWGVLT